MSHDTRYPPIRSHVGVTARRPLWSSSRPAAMPGCTDVEQGGHSPSANAPDPAGDPSGAEGQVQFRIRP